MSNSSVLALANNGNNIFAGTYYGVFLSTNNGNNWTQAGLSANSIMSLAISGNNIIAGVEDYPVGLGGVYISTNNGTNWSPNLFTPIQNVWAVFVNGNTVFAGADNGVYLSTNNGTNWTQTSVNNDYVYAFAVSGNNIFAGGDNGVYLSTNNGTNWTLTSLHVSMGALAVNGNNIFAGTFAGGSGQGVYLSTNNGINWTQTSLNNRNINSLAASGNNVFAGTYLTGFYVSNNNGTNWVQRNEGFTPNTVVSDLCILNNFIFAGTGGIGAVGVYRRPLGELITGIQPVSNEIPNKYSLSQNYPNPFNPSTVIRFSVPNDKLTTNNVQLIVYDVMGREVQTLVNESLRQGTYETTFDGSKLTSGVYFYRLTAGEFTDTKKLILLK